MGLFRLDGINRYNIMVTSIKDFRRSEDGASTVETVLWIPVFIAFFALLFDIAMIFNGQAATLRVIQEANRDYSVGQITTLAATKSRIETNLGRINITPSSVVPKQSNGVISTRVEIPVAELGSLGWFAAFGNLKIDITAEQTVENMES